MGKGGGSSKTPHEAPDDLKSSQMLTVVDAICEGPIEGPVDGLKSVRINKTPVLDSDGNAMVHGVTVVYRVGRMSRPRWRDSKTPVLKPCWVWR